MDVYEEVFQPPLSSKGLLKEAVEEGGIVPPRSLLSHSLI